MPSSRSLIAILDPDWGDERLATVGSEPTAWSDGKLLTVAVRRGADAPPLLVGTATARMRQAGGDRWAVRLRIPGIERAAVQFGILNEDTGQWESMGVWRGARAGPPARRMEVAIADAEVIPSHETEIANRHRVRFWSPARPAALMICADGAGLETWASLAAGAELPVALAGIDSAGISGISLIDKEYEPEADPRACAYLHHVKPSYFAAHMRYVIDSVLPWARARVDDLPALVFGTSNGAAFAAAAAAAHPDEFAGALVFSMGVTPPHRVGQKGPPHAFVAGRLEPGFHRTTRRYALSLRAAGVHVRLRRPVRGHDYSMWADEFGPALRWALEHAAK